MTPTEALIIIHGGWDDQDEIYKTLYGKAAIILREEIEILRLKAKKDQLERQLNEVNQKINQANTPF